MSYSSNLHPLISKTRDSLKQIGYQNALLLANYDFSDVLGESDETRTVSLAAFAQEPTSYKTACFAVVLTESDSPYEIEPFRALGAPMVFGLRPDENTCHLWKMTAQGIPEIRDQFSADELTHQIEKRKEQWSPSEVLRAKSIAFPNISPQTDFYDVGLVAAIEVDVHRKLNELLSDVVARSRQIYIERYGKEPDDQAYRALFQVVFRFMAAKLLGDRKHPGDWLDPDAVTVLQAVNKFYNDPVSTLPTLDAPIRNWVWDKIRTAIHFQNLSVEALAYVYENTFVDISTRQTLGTHATPYEIAEYIVRALPIEQLSQAERTIFEPFCGAAPFLIAALGRLRELLPPNMGAIERHSYLVRMLAGMEIDPFAREVALQSLILADYPNSNGWRILGENVFASPTLKENLTQTNVVLCNPPYGSWTVQERQEYTPRSANKAIEALLRVLQNPPKMLGFVLPLAYQNGQGYRAVRKEIEAIYGNVDIVKLPDNVFRHSSVETVLLLAYGNVQNTRTPRIVTLSKASYNEFKNTRTIQWDEKPLDRLWKELKSAIQLSSVAQIHRGIEYAKGFSHKNPHYVSHTQQDGFVPGIAYLERNASLYGLGHRQYITTEAEIVAGAKWSWSVPKVIVPTARKSRGQWVTAAAVDYDGLICSQSFNGIWASSGDLTLEVLAAVINGPVANAWISHQSGKRHSQIRFYATVPIPIFSSTQIELITRYVNHYLHITGTVEAVKILTKVDAAVLDAYGLSGEAERELLSWFSGARRPGVPGFAGYGAELEEARAEYRYELMHFQQLERYQDLVEKSFLEELTSQEFREKEHLSQTIDKFNEPFYVSVSQKQSKDR